MNYVCFLHAVQGGSVPEPRSPRGGSSGGAARAATAMRHGLQSIAQAAGALVVLVAETADPVTLGALRRELQVPREPCTRCSVFENEPCIVSCFRYLVGHNVLKGVSVSAEFSSDDSNCLRLQCIAYWCVTPQCYLTAAGGSAVAAAVRR